MLILDEPTGGLDQIGRDILTRVVNEMHKEKTTIIMISHDMDYVAETMQRLVTLAKGQIILDADPHRTFYNSAVLKQAWIEPPQITQLDQRLSKGDEPVISVSDFAGKYRR